MCMNLDKFLEIASVKKETIKKNKPIVASQIAIEYAKLK